MRKRYAIPVAICALLGAAMLWYLYGPRHVPPGQPPLAVLDAASLDTLRADFNRDANKTRIILLLSPTCTTCLRGASAVHDLLSRAASVQVRVFTVWEPILPTDQAPPLTSVLGRMADLRVQQYWDPRHALSDQMKKDARSPQPTQDCCVRNGHLWDLAAVYSAGTTWTDRMPTATLFNGSVLDVADQLAAALDNGATKPN